MPQLHDTTAIYSILSFPIIPTLPVLNLVSKKVVYYVKGPKDGQGQCHLLHQPPKLIQSQ